MNELNVKIENPKPVEQPTAKPSEKQVWETPKLEDVTEQVMAQPYIRFTKILAIRIQGARSTSTVHPFFLPGS